MLMMKQNRTNYKVLFSLFVVIILVGTGCGKSTTKKEEKSESISSEFIQEKVEVETNQATVKVKKSK